MAMQYWASLSFSRPLTEQECTDFESWLEEEFNGGDLGCNTDAAPLGDLYVSAEVGGISWLGYYELGQLEVGLERQEALPKDVTIKLTTAYKDCDYLGEEVTYYGPDAIHWEYADLIQERDKLQARIDVLAANLDKEESR